ncbi:cytochrome-ba3 oxidase subunit [Natronolimnobius sp. AArcel1]|uniref:cytochrome-ba3 oxidase subunit n=1 Tax=Natronolimnobius sp. AArcel1 TaxID=1679093 RepID=UPI0013EC9B8C|nr:cytochrome-ba3 oxidase subunit [Natronolimnobius sp. AArcel1]NGM68212.1 cytochrome-ba3 oxidase subunit [Natronolimnobius sp. AArcel1]
MQLEALSDLSPRRTLPIGLLALIPLTWYALASSVPAGVVSAINVGIILTCLYIAFGPVSGTHHDHDSESDSSGSSS